MDRCRPSSPGRAAHQTVCWSEGVIQMQTPHLRQDGAAGRVRWIHRSARRASTDERAGSVSQGARAAPDARRDLSRQDGRRRHPTVEDDIEAGHRPLPRGQAWASVGHCLASTLALVAGRRIHQPRAHLGRIVRFADGTSARVYRETVVDRPATVAPAVLVVAFRLRAVRGRGHALFRRESLLNTPLFVGFPGFVSKLWLTADEREVYRGLYQWDDSQQAERYARALWRVLELVCEPGSIRYRIVPGALRNAMLDHPERITADPVGAWWRVAEPWTVGQHGTRSSPDSASSGPAQPRPDYGDRSVQAGPSPLDGG